MNQSLFTSPELSAKLEKLRIKSQFDLQWYNCEEEGADWFLHKLDLGFQARPIDQRQAYHWSDLCLPENAKKIWGNEFLQEKTEDYLTRIQFKEDWQTWLEAEVDNKLAE